MGVYTHETEVSVALPPAKVYKAFFLDSDVLLPKVMPDHFKGTEIIQGDGGAGTIKKIHFVHEGKAGYRTHKVEEVDKEKLVYKYTLIEGGLLQNKVEKISYEIKIEAAGAGSIFKSVSKYYTKEGCHLTEQEIKNSKEKALAILKATEAYVVAHPDDY